jgi:hypothetical protein
MAIINCPECNKEVSDRARACPNCGNPMGVASESRPDVTIQATGKTHKMVQVIGVAITVLALPVFLASPVLGVLMLIGGPITYIVGRASAWAQHG